MNIKLSNSGGKTLTSEKATPGERAQKVGWHQLPRTGDSANKEEPPFANGYDVVPIVIPPNPDETQAPAHIIFKSAPIIWYEGREFYTVAPDISAPQLSIDKQRLRALANARWPIDGMLARVPMMFQLFITPTREIAGIRRIQGPKIPEIDRELANTQVMAPARFLSERVPVWIAVEIDIP